MSMVRKSDGLVGHGSILLTATIISGFANYLFHFYVIRALSTEDYGILFSLFAILMVIGVPAGSIRTVITKYVSGFKAKNQNGKIAFIFFHSIKRLFLFSSIGLAIFILLSGRLSIFLKIPSVVPVIIIGFVVLISFLCPPAFGTLQGLQKFTFLGIAICLGAILRVAFAVLLVHYGFGVNGALASSFFASIITFLVVFIPLYILFKKEDTNTDVGTGEIYRFLIPTLFTLACFNLITYIDVPVVKHFFSPLEAGYYSTAAVIGKAVLFPTMALAGAMFPKVSGSDGKSRFLLNKTMFLGSILLIFGILICFFFPKLIVIILMKKKDLTPAAFSTVVSLLRMFGLAMSPFALVGILIYYNLACHRTGFLCFLIGGTVLQVVLLCIFHSTLLQVVFVLGLSGFAIFICLFILTYSSRHD